ncbi:DUF2919 family protein, partial [Klebsiella quasipneumoniae]
MKNTEFIPADFDAHGRLRLPFLFWCVLLLQARTWVLFLMAGAGAPPPAPRPEKCFIARHAP